MPTAEGKMRRSILWLGGLIIVGAMIVALLLPATQKNATEQILPVSISEAEIVENQKGFHNPMEIAVSDAPYKKPSIPVCYAGYLLTKSGSHDPAFQTHLNCAEAGYTRSMLWLAYIYQNGLIEGGEDPVKATYWDQRAADMGNEVGMFNYGLDLLRGYGVQRNIQMGRAWIKRAAKAGHKKSLELIAADYDLSVVTPDSDEARWAPYQ